MKLKLTVLAMSAAIALAQGPNGPGGTGNPGMPNGPGGGSPAAGLGLNMAAQQTVEGTITAVQVAYGAQYPTIVVAQKQIKVAPVWWLLENDFEMKAGDAVKAIAASSNRPGDAYLYALSIEKSSGVKITLRNEAGVPLWIGAAKRGGNPEAPRTGTGCLDPASIRTMTGVIESVTAGLGIQHPSMILKSNGALTTIVLGPERILLDSGVELKAGATVTVRVGTATCSEENIALEITDEAGAKLVLRSDDGRPVWSN